MMLLQKFLREGGKIEELAERYAVRTRRHGEHPNLVLFKYDQVESPMGEPIVRECRGVVLDEAADWKVVARAFDKFFNHGEGHAAEVDWKTARVQEKVDGSLCVLYAYAGKWHVATTGTPDASGDVSGFGFSFADLFWKTLGFLNKPCAGERMCVFFELTSPFNRVVVAHAEASLTVLGGRNLETMEEISVDDARGLLRFYCAFGVPGVCEFPLGSFDEVAATFASMSPLAQEGYVVVDSSWRRVKVKHPGYVALHHAKDGLSRRAFVDITRSGESSEVVAAFPELAGMLCETKTAFDELVAEVEADLERLRGIEVQKDFALQATKTRCPAALFAVRSRKAESVRAFFRDCRTDVVMNLLGYKAEAPAGK